MNAERFSEIMDADVCSRRYDKCTALLGLQIISKYLPNSGIGAASHDQIFACGVDEIVAAGITEEDAIQLRDMNWMIDEESLSKFV